ncbi:MAG TPA: CsgG/HfaB family protein [Anaeromyxobacteraceae bacterium]|nr:CsgG/HfaB family protein [Anaeromyxobacteraceae bacterium]
MISSTSSSGRWSAALLALLAGLLPACASRQAPVEATSPVARLALFPLENLSGVTVPVKELSAALESKVAASGIEVVSGDILSRFFNAHRVRYTAGLDAETARAAREELGVDGVIVTSLETYSTAGSPRFAASMRLISVDDPPVIRWSDGESLAGDGSPGLFALAIIPTMDRVQDMVLTKLVGSLTAFLAGRPIPPPCPLTGRASPMVSFRAPSAEPGRHYSIAVLPFMNQTNRRSAGDLMALRFVQQLQASGRFSVVEPGVVRDQMLEYRVIMSGGVSLDTARTLLALLKADLVLAGYVRRYEEGLQSALNTPKVTFTVIVLDRKTERVVWQMTSSHEGMDGVFFYDAGRVETASDLTCRMVRAAVEQMGGSQ